MQQQREEYVSEEEHKRQTTKPSLLGSEQKLWEKFQQIAQACMYIYTYVCRVARRWLQR